MIHDLNRRQRLRFLRLATLVLIAGKGGAHDIPSDVTVRAFIRPEGQRLQFLVRVPLTAMRDIDFPVTGPGYLDVEAAMPQLTDAATVWISQFVRIEEGGARLRNPQITALRLSVESDRSFVSFEAALAHMSAPGLATSAHVVPGQTLLDVLFEYPIRSERGAFSIRPGLQHLAARVLTVLRFLPAGDNRSRVVRAYEFLGDPGLVPLDPSRHQAAGRFVQLGFFHILDGTDHLLFLICLVIPFRRFRALVGVVTAFTVAHSITLIASAFRLAPDALWFPPLIETLIAVSIVYMALENIVGGVRMPRRWMMAFAFGLVHGFGFSFALRETLQFAGSHLLASLLAFNAGVELGQLLVLLVLIPALTLLFRHVVEERMGTIILSALVAHTGWHWMLERAAYLRQFRFGWPEMNAAFLADATRGMFWMLLLGGVGWGVRWQIRRRPRRG